MKSDWSLVGFTVLAQAAVGTTWGLAASWALVARQAGSDIAAAATSWGVHAVPALAALAVAVSLAHLGRPDRAWLALANLEQSWLSREVLAAVVFGAASVVPLVRPAAQRETCLLAASGLGALLLLAMVRTYRMRTIPAWNSWAPAALFGQSALASGGAITAFALAVCSPHPRPGAALVSAALVGAAAVAVGPLVSLGWRHVLARQSGAARRAAERLTRWQPAAAARWATALLASMLLLAAPALAPAARVRVLAAAAFLALASELGGREMFYRARVRTGL